MQCGSLDNHRCASPRQCGNESGGTRDTEWNVIPYKEDPNKMVRFGDLTQKDLGSREKLYQAKYLHYQQAETNTSIREGWFYRDEDKQKVRSADDVFDIYERSVGGNSTFLLNIPPNRAGMFSPEDVKVLNEVGQRIQDTYGTNLFDGASGPSKVLDADIESYELLDDSNEITISAKSPVTINRLVLQEAITTHSERIEKHVLEAWVDNDWKSIATATNVGYKRILRFKEVTSNKFRIRVSASRFTPAISNITAHYYKTRPPQLVISRNKEGKLTIVPKKHDFGWKPHGEDAVSNLNAGYEIRYTTDGSIPTKASKLFETPETIASAEVKAVAIDKDEMGSVTSHVFGILKTNWTIRGTDSQTEKHSGINAFDENPNTYWQSEAKGKSHYLALDLGRNYNLKGFAYTPQTRHANGMIEQGVFKVSQDGNQWETIETFEFGNLINDPVRRRHYFKKGVTARFIRIESRTIAGGKETAAIAELDIFE